MSVESSKYKMESEIETGKSMRSGSVSANSSSSTFTSIASHEELQNRAHGSTTEGRFDDSFNEFNTTSSLSKLQTPEYEDKMLSWPGRGLAAPKHKGKLASSQYNHVYMELLRGSARGAVLGFAFRALIGGLFQAMKGKLNAQYLLSEDVMKFARFTGAFTGLFRATNAFLTIKNEGEETARNAAIAGAVASLSLILEDAGRKKDIALYLFVRSIDILIKRGVRVGNLPDFSYYDELFFGICNMPIMYSFIYDPKLMDPGYYRWISGMGNLSHDRMETAFRTGKFTTCNEGHYHEGNCTQHIALDFFQGLLRAAKIYVPVHLIPVILFKMKNLVKEPVKTTKHFLYGLLLSCLFLSTYVQIAKASICFGKSVLKADYALTPAIGGLLTGFATMFERKSRVSELMIYCWPRSLEIAFNFAQKHWGMTKIPFWEYPLFMIAMSIIMSSNQHDFKPTFHAVFSMIVGSKSIV